jgi:hypothetical protein
MAVEVYKSNYVYSATWFAFNVFDMATFFSQSSHFSVIDSYSPNSTPNRYKGDPVADGIWNSFADCSQNDIWFIIECITTRHSSLGLPNWQAKFQFQVSSPGLEDVSDPTGVKYPKNHHVRLHTHVRFAAYGGWDLATSLPDFNPTGGGLPAVKSTQNHRILLHTSPDDSRFYLVCDDGCMLFFSRKNREDFTPFGIGCIIGDVDPVENALMPMPRAFLGAGSGATIWTVGTNHWLAEQNFLSNTIDYATTEGGVGVCFYDGSLNLIQEGFRVPTGTYILGTSGETQPNKYGDPPYGFDFAPFMPIPKTTEGVWFSVPLIRKGYGLGHSIVNSKTWLSSSNKYCLYIKWDGSTDIFA